MRQLFAIKPDLDRLFAFHRPIRNYSKILSVWQVNDSLFDHGNAYIIQAIGRVYRIKTQHLKNIPGRHLSAIFITSIAIGLIVVHRIHNAGLAS